MDPIHSERGMITPKCTLGNHWVYWLSYRVMEKGFIQEDGCSPPKASSESLHPRIDDGFPIAAQNGKRGAIWEIKLELPSKLFLLVGFHSTWRYYSGYWRKKIPVVLSSNGHRQAIIPTCQATWPNGKTLWGQPDALLIVFEVCSTERNAHPLS